VLEVLIVLRVLVVRGTWSASRRQPGAV